MIEDKLLNDVLEQANKSAKGDILKTREDMSLYDFVKKQYSFGTRLVAVPKQQQTVEDLQSARGLTIDVNAVKEQNFNKISKTVEQYQTKDCEKRMKCLLKYVHNKINYYEIGFRSVDSLKLATKHFENVSGCDVIPLSVLIAKQLNFNVFRHDLMCPDSLPGQLGPDAIAVYHVLEHTHNPEFGIKKIKEFSKPGTIVQFEVPIQPGKPILRYAHLFAFEKNDLKQLLIENGGFKILESEVGADERHICEVI